MHQPLHLDVANALRTRIERGEWAAGARIPSVRALARELDVSPLTVTRAIHHLSSTGQVETIRGKGTYIAQGNGRPVSMPADLSWQNAILRQPISTRASQIVMPLIRSMDFAGDLIVLASGGESTDVLPASSLESAWRGLLKDVRSEMLAGWAAEGEIQTRQWMASYVRGAGIETSPENIIVTNGGQQALSLVAQTLLEAEDTVLVERPMYSFALSIFDSMGVRCIDVAVNADGSWVNAAEDLIERFRPKLVLTVPTGQVPTGTTMPVQRRIQLYEAARRHGIVILEDDHASEMFYEGSPPPAIKHFDRHGHVIYAKSFSKITLPALRIGAIIAEGPILQALQSAKLVSDRYTSTIIQSAFLAYVSSPAFERDLRRKRSIYKVRRDAMLDALSETMPPGTEWTVPSAGFYAWLTMPEEVSAQEVALRAAANGVLVARGGPFHAQADPDRGVRLTFSSNEPETIRTGIARLAEAINAASRAGSTRVPQLDKLGIG